ncbi:MAG: hypothetical protein P8L44_02880 [Opitutales bacterium]|nr:hypothetical protein [Opitutales bacterium]
MTSPNKNPNQSWTDMVAASRNESPVHVDVRSAVRAELESLSSSSNQQSWAEMVAASRNESPAPVDVRYAVRAMLESLLRSGNLREDAEADWTSDIIRLFNPGFVKLGVAAAFVGMLVLAGTNSVLDSEFDSDYADPLVTMNTVEADAEAEWSDWL